MTEDRLKALLMLGTHEEKTATQRLNRAYYTLKERRDRSMNNACDVSMCFLQRDSGYNYGRPM